MPMTKARWLFKHLALLVFLVLLPSAALAEEPENAWQALRQHCPAAAADISMVEKQVLEALTPQQAAAFAEGLDPAEIAVSGSSLAELLAKVAEGISFDLSWYTLNSGGGTSTGGAFLVRATIGQVDAGHVAGGAFRLFGGYQTRRITASAIFRDGFESGDVSSWTISVGLF